eukprot:COSAG06_NODE_19954_length_816_cov_1.133891_1_plen_43_part_10
MVVAFAQCTRCLGIEQSRSSRVGNAPILIDQNSDVKIIMRHHS